MSFFFSPLIRAFLAEQAIDMVCREVHAEMSARATDLRHDHPTDFAILFGNKAEMVGLLDLCSRTTTTQGNGITFHTTTLRKKRVVIAATEPAPVRVTEAVLEVFRPQRLISAGFVRPVAAGGGKNRFFVPDRVISSKNETSINLWQRPLLQSSEAENRDKKNHEFSTGTLLSGEKISKNSSLFEKYHPFATDLVTFSVLQTCQEWNVPCFPLKIIADVSRTQHSFSRKLGHFVRNFLDDPASSLKTLGQHADRLVTSDLLAKKLLQLFFSSHSSREQ